MPRDERLRLAVNRHYARNRDAIITHKTMKLAREVGRVPRESTIESHGMNRDELKTILLRFATDNPSTRAANKIYRFTGSAI